MSTVLPVSDAVRELREAVSAWMRDREALPNSEAGVLSAACELLSALDEVEVSAILRLLPAKKDDHA